MRVATRCGDNVLIEITAQEFEQYFNLPVYFAKNKDEDVISTIKQAASCLRFRHATIANVTKVRDSLTNLIEMTKNLKG